MYPDVAVKVNAVYVEKNEEVKKSVGKFLVRIGLFANLKGFNYILSAVDEVLANPTCLNSIMKELYPKIAQKFNVTTSGVERNIRNAIEVAYNKGKLFAVANTFYGANFAKYEKPTNGEFLAFIFSTFGSDDLEEKFA